MARPCHFREVSGAPVHWQDHPNCTVWDGRPHYNNAVSPDKLGTKSIEPSDTTYVTQTGIVLYSGPDREHTMASTSCAAARLTGSLAMQAELEAQATLFLLGETVPSMKPGWSTNGSGAARSIGCACKLAVRLYQDLENRPLAEALLTRLRKRVDEVYLPLGNIASGIFDIRTDDPRLGPGQWWMPDQQGQAVDGFDEVGIVFDIPALRALALKGAKRVLADAWVLIDGRWKSRPRMPVAGGGLADESFNYFGMSMAVAVVRRQEPENWIALAIWTQLVTEANEVKETQWLAPDVVRMNQAIAASSA
jgi:hypothetical protein